MTLRFSSQDNHWTDEMKATVRDKVVRTAEEQIGHSHFDLSVFINGAKNQSFDIWLILQSQEPRSTFIIRQHGKDFESTIEDLQKGLIKKMKQESPRRSFFTRALRALRPSEAL